MDPGHFYRTHEGIFIFYTRNPNMELETVRFGSTGLHVSELALGTARFGDQRDGGTEKIDRWTANDLLDRYAAAGGNFIDMADVYGDGRAETYVGDWLTDRDRDKYVLASKVYWPTDPADPNAQGLNRKHLRAQVDRILNRLGTDYLDILYIHRWDEDAPTREFLRTLNRFVEDGRVHFLSASNRDPNAWQVARANEIAKHEGYEPFSATQIVFNLVDRGIESEFIPMVEELGLGLMPFSPLAGGFLTGKYDRNESPPSGSRGAREQGFRERYFTEEGFDVIDAVESIAEDFEASPVSVSLAWLLHHQAVTAPVVGPRTVAQLEENLAATRLDLDATTFERLTNVGAAPY
jgi:aryl-alcohol dehydrogenase-like predicted oxidoreductase